MYTFNKEMDKEEYNKFVSEYPMASIMQQYEWSNIKNNWDNLHVGLYKDDKLVAVALILIKTIFKNIKMFYVPRGYLIDFKNKEDLEEMTKNIKKLAKENNAFMVKLDPNFCSNQYSIKENDIITPYSDDYELKNKNLMDLGYKHKKKAIEIGKNYQPQYNVFAPTIDSNGNIINIDELSNTYKSKFRYYLGKYHEKRGVSFEITDDLNKIDNFVNLLKETEERQNINLRDKSYFERILKNYKDQAYLFFAKCDLNKYLDFLKENNKSEDEVNEVLELLKEDKEIYLSTGLLILPKNKNGIRTSEYLYAGNSNKLRRTEASTGCVFELIKYSLKNNCHYCNLGGVDGNLSDRLYTFKEKYNGQVLEFTGEYDLIINKFLYYSYNIAFNILRNIKKIIKR